MILKKVGGWGLGFVIRLTLPDKIKKIKIK
jgi:hypothetical protein